MRHSETISGPSKQSVSEWFVFVLESGEVGQLHLSSVAVSC